MNRDHATRRPKLVKTDWRTRAAIAFACIGILIAIIAVIVN